MELSIVIVSYNTCKILDDCLASIYSLLDSNAVEIIVVDNNSKDGTCQMIKEKYHRVYLIENKKNVGFGSANNQGMIVSKGSFILLLNSDTVATSQAIKECKEYILRDPSIGVIGCKLMKPDGNVQLSCGKTYNLWNALFGGMEINKIFKSLGIKKNVINPYLLSLQEHGEIQDVDWIAGAFMLLRREVFQGVGGFDENIFLYNEEIEWCYRIKKKGWHILFYPKVSILHIEKASTSYIGELEINKKMLSGRLYFFKKHYGLLKALIYKNFILLSALIKSPIWFSIYVFSGFKQHPKNRLIFQVSSLKWYFSGKDLV